MKYECINCREQIKDGEKVLYQATGDLYYSNVMPDNLRLVHLECPKIKDEGKSK
jgi:hypothetical protein